MKLLIGYDGSSYSDAAINDLLCAGLPNDVEALVVSVGDALIIPPLGSHEVIEKAFAGETVLTIVEHANRQVSKALEHANELVLKASRQLNSYFTGWQVRGEVLAGNPASELIRKASEWKADLIVVGSQGRSALGRLILGSVSLEVARKSQCSVRIGRQTSTQTQQTGLRILVGLDGSPGAERAVRKVLLRTWPAGTELRIVAVDDGVSPIKSDLFSISAQELREGASVTAGRMVTLVGAKGLTVSAGLKKGEAQRVLIAEARQWKADCIVIGSRVNTPSGFFANSVSTGLAANAECSVEIVR